MGGVKEMLRRRGQSTLEYAVVIAVVAGALLLMNHYIRRGVEGKLRESTDQIGEQYSAGNMTSNYDTRQDGEMITKETFGLSTTEEGTFNQGVSHYEVTKVPSEIRRSGSEEITKKLSEEKL